MTYYATPVTPTDFANLIALITWPQDCNLQRAAMDRCLDVISALKRGWAAMQPIRLFVGSDTPPGLSDWQAAWVDLGHTLPISGNVIGVWETLTNAIKDTAEYVWIENDMRPTLARWWNGSSEFILTTPNQYSNNATTNTVESNLISESLTLNRSAYIEAAWAAVIEPTAANLILWRSSFETLNTVRGFIPTPSGSYDPKINILHEYAPTKSSGTINVYFRTLGGVGIGLYFTNFAVTRKIESGLWGGAAAGGGGYSSLGEISSLTQEAIYLA